MNHSSRLKTFMFLACCVLPLQLFSQSQTASAGWEPLTIVEAPKPVNPITFCMRISGYVILTAVLTAEGNVDEIVVQRHLGKGKFGFEKAAKDALQQWRFLPLVCDGKPQSLKVRITCSYCYARLISLGGCNGGGVYSADWSKVEILNDDIACLENKNRPWIVWPY